MSGLSVIFIALLIASSLPMTARAEEGIYSQAEVPEAYEQGFASVDVKTLNIRVSEEKFAVPSFIFGDTVYAPLRDIGNILGCKTTFDNAAQRAYLTRSAETLDTKVSSKFTEGKKTAYLNTKITAFYKDVDFGRVENATFTVNGFIVEGKLFVSLSTVTRLLGYIGNTEGDDLILRSESHMLRYDPDFSWIIGEEWELTENAKVSPELINEALAIEKGYATGGGHRVTKQRAEVYQNKDTGAMRIFVYTDGYWFTEKTPVNLGAYYDVLDKPSQEGSLFGAMGGHYTD